MSLYLKQHQDTLLKKLLVHELDQCAPSCAFSIESYDQTGATIDTSWGQLMISSHGGDNMLARFEAGVNTFPHISQMKYFCQ